MEPVTDPVSVAIKEVSTQSARQSVEKVLIRIFLEYKITKGVENLLDRMPVQIIETVSRGSGLLLAQRLKDAGAVVSVISESTGEDLSNCLSKVEEPSGPESNGKRKILVVEDSKAQLNFICKILNTIGNVEIDKAENGVEAIVHLSKNTYDVVITDLTMPYMDGLKLLQYLRAHNQTMKTPVLVLTARATQSDVKRAVEFNISGYILKPVDEKRVLKQVNEILDEIKQH